MALWADIKDLSREDFIAVLDRLASSVAKAKPKKTRASAKTAPAASKPVTRIAQVLRVDRALSDDDARRELCDALLKRGYEQSDIPVDGDTLERWLEQLLKRVSSADAIDAARRP